jgi:hypothetical protein
MTDLADALIRAIEQQRDQLNTEAALFVGRLPFHVDVDANVAMRRVQVRVRPCREPCPEERA